MSTEESNNGPSGADGPGYAAAMAELEQILEEMEGEDPDVDVLADRVERAANAHRDLPAPDHERRHPGRESGGRARVGHRVVTVPAGQRAEPPAELAAIAARVQIRLGEILAAEREEWAALDPSLDEPLGDLADMVLGGGKRIRPAYCHWGWLVGGGDPSGDGALDGGCALEILHAFALAHDDVMDGSDTRRGAPTVWRKLRAAPSLQGVARRGPALR